MLSNNRYIYVSQCVVATVRFTMKRVEPLWTKFSSIADRWSQWSIVENRSYRIQYHTYKVAKNSLSSIPNKKTAFSFNSFIRIDLTISTHHRFQTLKCDGIPFFFSILLLSYSIVSAERESSPFYIWFQKSVGPEFFFLLLLSFSRSPPPPRLTQPSLWDYT